MRNRLELGLGSGLGLGLDLPGLKADLIFSGSIRTVQDLSFSMGSIMIHCDQSGPTEIDQDLTAINVAMICKFWQWL